MDWILEDYENRLTPLLQQRAVAFWSIASETHKLLHQMEEGLIVSADFHARHRTIMTRHAQPSRRAREVTEEAVRRAVDLLSPNAHAEFIMLAKSEAFPELYPDHSAPHRLFDSLMRCSELDPGSMEIVEDHYQSYAAEYASICNELESMCIEWGDRSTQGVVGYEPQFLADALDPLLKKCDEVSEKWKLALDEALGQDAVTAYAQASSQLVE